MAQNYILNQQQLSSKVKIDYIDFRFSQFVWLTQTYHSSNLSTSECLLSPSCVFLRRAKTTLNVSRRSCWTKRTLLSRVKSSWGRNRWERSRWPFLGLMGAETLWATRPVKPEYRIKQWHQTLSSNSVELLHEHTASADIFGWLMREMCLCSSRWFEVGGAQLLPSAVISV